MRTDDYIVSRHGFRELANDDVLQEDLIVGVMAAVLVEDYPDGRKEPSVLPLRSDRDGAVHVMWGIPGVTGIRPFW